ncbi:MAG TPA: ABC transporter substrate-binding protein [Symbiobacteriaceae bacterium]|nr:ABC transporter substrate-binding protein [Symbiobacteriaceae bacterium]
MKRRYTMAAVLALTALMITACGGAAKTNTATPAPAAKETKVAEEPKEITVYTSHTQEIHTPLIKAFEEKTGIKVQVIYAGSGDLFKRIEAEAANPLGDVMFGGGAETHEASKKFLEPYKSKEAANLAEGMIAADNAWTGFTALPIVMMYNTKLVPADQAPKSFADLLDPKWKGKIAMPDAAKSGSAYTTVVTMLHAIGRDDNKGWDFIKKLVPQMKVLGSSTQPPKGANDGEYAIALTHEEGAVKYVTAGGPVKVVYPAEGTSNVPDAISIIKGAKHPNNAKIFVDFMVSKELQENVVKTLNRRSVRTDVAPTPGLADIKSIKFIKYDMNWAATQREKVLETWKGIITQ